MNTTTARQSPRIEYQVPVQLAHAQGVAERDAIPARTINVSAGGMALGVPAPVAIGEAVVCHIQVAGRRASLTGEVTWSRPDDDDDDDGDAAHGGHGAQARVGVRFEHLDEHGSEVLDHLLANAVGPTRPVSVRFEGMERPVLARGRMHAQALRLSAPIPILASGTPVDLQRADGSGEIDGEVLDSRLVHIGRTPVIEVDIGVDEDGPRARRRTFYGRASKLDTLEHPVAHIGDPTAAAATDAATDGAAARDDTEPPPAVDATWHRARLHTRRMWQPTPNGEHRAWEDSDDTSRDLLPPAHHPGETGPPKPPVQPRPSPWRKQPGWSTVLAAAVASALGTLWLAQSGPQQALDASAPGVGHATAPMVAAPPRPEPLEPAEGASDTWVAGASANTPDPAPGADVSPTAPTIKVTANRQQTQVRIPISGRPADIETHLWKKPVAVVTQLSGSRVLAAEGTHRVRRHGVSHVSITSPDVGSQVRVITSLPVANYSVTATAEWLEVRITPSSSGRLSPRTTPRTVIE